MNTKWNLNVLYKGLDDPEYEKDMKKAEELFAKLKAVVRSDEADSVKKIEDILLVMEEIEKTTGRLGAYIGFSQAVNTKDGALMAQMARLMRMFSDAAEDEAAAKKILGQAGDVDALTEKSQVIKDYRTFVKRAEKEYSHLLPDEVEAMAAAMDMTGGSAWGQLQSFMSSTLKVDYKGEVKTLSEIRNLAYDADQEVRKEAYEAELKSYEKVQDAIAFALNNIKNQVTMMSKKRG